MKNRTKEELLAYTDGLKMMMAVVIFAQTEGYHFKDVCRELVYWDDQVLAPWIYNNVDAQAAIDDLLMNAYPAPLPQFLALRAPAKE